MRLNEDFPRFDAGACEVEMLEALELHPTMTAAERRAEQSAQNA